MLRSATMAALMLRSLVEAQAAASTPAPVHCEREADCLAKLKGLVSRKAETLILKVEGGRSKVFQGNARACDEGDADNCISHKLRAYLPAQNAYVVQWIGYEDDGAYVISTKTGTMVRINTMPEFSPSGRWVVSVDSDELNARPYDVAIWATDPEYLKEELRYTRDANGPYEAWEFLGWDGDERIRFKVYVNNGHGPMTEVETTAVHWNDGWKLNWHPPNANPGRGTVGRLPLPKPP